MCDIGFAEKEAQLVCSGLGFSDPGKRGRMVGENVRRGSVYFIRREGHIRVH